jgi:diguanylate cyclase
LDLDGFKQVNDTYGHDVGDLLLLQVATRLRECVRASDIAGRMGGDEFVLLLTDNPDQAVAAQIAQKVIARISEPYSIGGVMLNISTSVGMALYPDDATTADQLLVLADNAMYLAKRSGGRGYQSASVSSNASRY